jgi:hypothetical protein
MPPSMQREDRRVGYKRYGTAATRWCSANTSTMSPIMRLSSKSLGVYARHAGRAQGGLVGRRDDAADYHGHRGARLLELAQHGRDEFGVRAGQDVAFREQGPARERSRRPARGVLLNTVAPGPDMEDRRYV